MTADDRYLLGPTLLPLVLSCLWGCVPEADLQDLERYCAAVEPAPPPLLQLPSLEQPAPTLPPVGRSPFVPPAVSSPGRPSLVPPLRGTVATPGSCGAEGDRAIDRVSLAQLRVPAVVSVRGQGYALVTLRSAAAPSYVVRPGGYVGCPAARVRHIGVDGVLLERPDGGEQLLEVWDGSP